MSLQAFHFKARPKNVASGGALALLRSAERSHAERPLVFMIRVVFQGQS